MILSGPEIIRQQQKGNIIISPFEERQVNPNSYNLRLDNQILCYDTDIYPVLDIKKNNPTKKIKIPDDGIILYPGVLYLGQTVEYTETRNFVPLVEGRSSIGRLGLFVHITAGVGDNGFCGRWTLEMCVIHPIRIYAGIEIAQIIFHLLFGESQFYQGKYQNAKEVGSSKLFEELAV